MAAVLKVDEIDLFDVKALFGLRKKQQQKSLIFD
jgi:hypothetical protein